MNQKEEKPTAPAPINYGDPSACKDLKDTYNTCFNNWFSEKFLKGYNQQECDEQWKEYQTCLKEKIKAWQLEALQKRENNKHE